MGLPVAASQSHAPPRFQCPLAVTTILPSGLRIAALRGLTSMNGPVGLPVAASHGRALPSGLTVSTVLPSWLKATAQTPPAKTARECHRGGATSLAMAISHNRAAPSRLPVRTVLPSGLKATLVTASECCRGKPIGLPVAASHNRAVLSSLPVSTVLPSGLKATVRTQ